MVAISLHKAASVLLANWIFFPSYFPSRKAASSVFNLSPNPTEEFDSVLMNGFFFFSDKMSEKIALSTYFLGLELIVNKKIPLKNAYVYASDFSPSRTCSGTGVVQQRHPLGSVNNSVLYLAAVCCSFVLSACKQTC